MSFKRNFIAVTFFIAASLPAAADSVFNTFNASPPLYAGGSGWTVAGASSAVGEFSSAAQFTAGASGGISQIVLGVGSVIGSGGGTVSLWTAVLGLPGTSLGSWAFNSSVSFGSCCDVVTVSTPSGPSVVSGQDYFLLLQADSGDWLAWNHVNATGLTSYSSGGGPFNEASQNQYGAFSIATGSSAVPEPSTWMSLGLGLVSFAALRLRRR